MLAVAALGAFYAVLLGVLQWQRPAAFISPDETANYFFTAVVREVGSPVVASVSNATWETMLLHPRAVAVRDLDDGAAFVPASFMGLPLLYGFLAKIIGLRGTGLFAILFSLLSIPFLFAICKKLWSVHIAWLASGLLLLHPAWWYFQGRPYYHNGLFTVMAIMATYFLVRVFSAERAAQRWWWYAAGGALYGAAAAVRTIEMLWMVGVAAVVMVAYRQRVRWTYAAVGAACAVLFFSPILFLNNDFFGDPLSFGVYASDPVAGDSVQQAATAVASKFHSALFPFGIDLGLTVQKAWTYGFEFYWWLTVPALAGFLFQLARKVRGRDWRAVAALVALGLGGAYLLIYYGSWLIYDIADTSVDHISSSVVRYWLPLYVAGMPFAALVYHALWRRWREMSAAGAMLLAGCAVFVMLAAVGWQVLYEPLDGQLTLQRNLEQFVRMRSTASSALPADAIIVSGKGDKIFFPQWSVLQDAVDPSSAQLLRRMLAAGAPVYLYARVGATETVDLLPEGVVVVAAGVIRLDPPTPEYLYPLVFAND